MHVPKARWLHAAIVCVFLSVSQRCVLAVQCALSGQTGRWARSTSAQAVGKMAAFAAPLSLMLERSHKKENVMEYCHARGFQKMHCLSRPLRFLRCYFSWCGQWTSFSAAQISGATFLAASLPWNVQPNFDLTGSVEMDCKVLLERF